MTIDIGKNINFGARMCVVCAISGLCMKLYRSVYKIRKR